MFSKALLSLLSPLHSLAGANENKAVAHKHTALGIIAGANQLQQQGQECVLTKRKWMGNRPRRRILSSKLGDEKDGHTKPDVGILGLGRRQKKCTPDKEVCEADASSSLGGRCVPTASSSSTTTSRRLSEETELCFFKCPDPKVCKCYHSDGSDYSEEECTESMASACRNGDIEKCFPNKIQQFKGLYCPYYECLYEGNKDDYECIAAGYEAYDKFCVDHLDEWKDAESNTTYCEEAVKYASVFNNSFYMEYLTNPNMIKKKEQLIMERFDECVANSSSSEEVYAYDYRCQCQMNSEQCELISRLYGGREHYAQQSDYCQVANCCNTTAPNNLTSCIELNKKKTLELTYQRFFDCMSASEEGYHCTCQLYSEVCEFMQASNTEVTYETSLQEYRCQVAKCCNTTSLDNLTACYELGSYNGAYIYNGAHTSPPESAEPTSQPSDEPPMKESYPPPPENNGSEQDKSSSAFRSIKSSLALTLLLANAMGFLSFIFK